MNAKTVIPIIVLSFIIFSACSLNEEVTNNSNYTKNIKASISSTPEVEYYAPNKTLISKQINIDKNKHNVYEGVIGNDKIMIDIYRKKDKLVAYYLYENTVDEIEMDGKIKDSAILLKSQKNSEVASQIEAYCLKDSDDIEGTFITSETHQSKRIVLKLSHIVEGELNERYMFCVNKNKDVENFAAEIKQYIINDEKKKISRLIHYPIDVNLKDKKIIQNASEFIEYYDQIITSKFKRTISDTYTKYMFSNSHGIMFGSETRNMWISKSTKSNKFFVDEIIS